MFHGETALRKILTFQEETANFSEKFQGEIQVFSGENMELHRQNIKISGRNTGISWRKMKDFLENFPLFLPEKRGSWSWRKIKRVFFFFFFFLLTYKRTKFGQSVTKSRWMTWIGRWCYWRTLHMQASISVCVCMCVCACVGACARVCVCVCVIVSLIAHRAKTYTLY